MLSYNQTPEVDPTTTSSPVSVDGTSTAPASASSSAGDSTTGNDTAIQVNNSTINYCFLEAQNWVGVDVAPPDCTSDPNNTLCTDPDAANRIVSLRIYSVNVSVSS